MNISEEKFQEFNCVNVNWDLSRFIKEYEAGWDTVQHCSCHICELRREEDNLSKCVKGSCEGCKNLATGKKIKSYSNDLLGEQ